MSFFALPGRNMPTGICHLSLFLAVNILGVCAASPLNDPAPGLARRAQQQSSTPFGTHSTWDTTRIFRLADSRLLLEGIHDLENPQTTSLDIEIQGSYGCQNWQVPNWVPMGSTAALPTITTTMQDIAVDMHTRTPLVLLHQLQAEIAALSAIASQKFEAAMTNPFSNPMPALQ